MRFTLETALLLLFLREALPGLTPAQVPAVAQARRAAERSLPGAQLGPLLHLPGRRWRALEPTVLSHTLRWFIEQ